jgi:hypothetical protein
MWVVIAFDEGRLKVSKRWCLWRRAVGEAAALRCKPVRMRFETVFSTRSAEIDDFLSILFSHDNDSGATVDTDDAVVRA